jgi:hypothetical protein
MFDHEIVARLVELGFVETEPLPSGDIEYRITDAGPDRQIHQQGRAG